MRKPAYKAFTLAELLIALAILGVIATFAIPKILQGQQDAQRKAVFRETIASLYSVFVEGLQAGKINHDQSAWMTTYILPRMNAIKICPTDSQAEGCWTQPFAPNPGERNSEGYLLHSGASVSGLSGGWEPVADQWEDGIIMDWNGTAGPNVDGEDQMYLVMCIGPKPCWGGVLKPGQIVANSAASDTLFTQIFSH